MPFAAALSTQPQTTQAVNEACAQVRAALAEAPDLAVAFFTPHHAEDAALVSRTVREQLQPRRLLGAGSPDGACWPEKRGSAAG